ncbi:hypothetical protein E9840_04340 [Tissierella creatinini]|nr:hypothetical protein E9840_04340 [Tissierella creatinini]TJX63118.1 hypothetical protein E8P77_15830 [Soehngenia saccharolytica]
MIDTNKETIISKQGIYLVAIFTLGTSIILSGVPIAKQDIWLSLLIAFFSFIPLVFIYSKILSFFPGKNLFEILEICFGKIVGKILSSLYVSYFFFLGALVIRDITEFIQVASLRLTPQYFSGLMIILVGVYNVRSGFQVTGRLANFAFNFILFLLTIIFAASITKLDFTNLLPVLYRGWSPIIENSIILFAFPFGDIVIFLALFNNLKDQKKTSKVLFTGISISALLLLLNFIRSIAILGFPMAANVYFPVYYANTFLRFDNILENMGIFSAIILLLSGLGKYITCLFAACIGLKHIFNSKNYKSYALPVGFLTLITSQLLFSSTMELMDHVKVYPYQVIPLQVPLPLIILIFSWRKSRKYRKS